uniref:Odorant-binding protein n=1 Tax=Anoplophora chinensis TaxID=217632 RepID=A0A2H4ZB40_ANOCN|nr:odorant-binding protein [Anoplophora chinensis]
MSVKMVTALFLVVVTAILAMTSVEAIVKQSDFPPKLKELAISLHATCVSKTGIDEALIDKVLNGEFVEEPKMKAYMTCILLEGTLIDEKGTPNLEFATTLIPENIKEESMKNIKHCYAVNEDVTDLEEKIFRVFKCYYYINSDIFIFF